MSSEFLKDKTAVVIGGTGPIGAAVARKFEMRGARVAVISDDAKPPCGMEGILNIRADVGETSSLERALEKVTERLGDIEILVSAAGHRVTGSFLDVDPAELSRTIDVDVRSAFFGLQQVARSMRERQAAGRVIFLISPSGVRAIPGSCAHGVAQAMKMTLAQVAAVELGGDGITCNVVSTGWVDSPFMDRVDKNLAVASTPAGRLIEPDEIADVCAFLASDGGSGVNGAVIAADGGYAVSKSAGGTPILPGG